MLRLPVCKTPMAQGGVLKASSYLYGTHTDRKGLVVLSKARTHDDDKMCGTSDDGGFSVEIEKPSKHSKGELLKMFDDVKANGWWPHPTSSIGQSRLPNQNKNPCKP
ncbi:hypothetical protein ACSQ67_016314 [Phaseolus vulgaris]